MSGIARIAHETWYDQGILIDDFYTVTSKEFGHKEFNSFEKAVKFCEDNNLLWHL